MIKPDSSIRITIDYTKLNEIIVADAYPMKNTQMLFQELEKSEFFTKLDVSHA